MKGKNQSQCMSNSHDARANHEGENQDKLLRPKCPEDSTEDGNKEKGSPTSLNVLEIGSCSDPQQQDYPNCL